MFKLLFTFSFTLVLFIVTNNNVIAQNTSKNQSTKANSNKQLDVYKGLIEKTIKDNPRKCLNYIKELEKLSIKEKEVDYQIYAYNSYARYYYWIKNYSRSIKYFDKELKLRINSGKSINIAEAYYNLGSTCYKMGKYSKAKQNFELSLKNTDDKKDKDLILTNYNALVKTYESIVKYKSANIYLKKYIDLKDGYVEEEMGLYKQKYSNEKKVKEATIKKLNHTNKTLKIKKHQLTKTKTILDSTITDLEETKDSVEELEIATIEKNNKIEGLQIKTKLSEMEIKQNKKIISQQKKITFILILGISIVLLLAIFLLRLFIKKKKMNIQLRESQKEIELKNSHITKSIIYASKIQKALLPTENYFKDNFSDSFVIFKPRDIVSGDFYYIRKINDFIVFAAVDCTGHGVPGAFMSMLGASFLDNIIRKQAVTSSSQVLNLMRDEVKRALHQTGKKGEQKDGMDIALCAYNTKTKELQYSGAHNSLVLIRNNELIEYKADRMPIGIHRKEKSFTDNSVKIELGDKIYLYSDGFQDQMGGEENKKYKAKRFKQLLLDTSTYNMLEQKNLIEQEFEKWKADYKQIDDIVILGISF